MFSDPEDAAASLRAYLPVPVTQTLRWSNLAVHDSRFVDDDLREREFDLLFAVEPEARPAGQQQAQEEISKTCSAPGYPRTVVEAALRVAPADQPPRGPKSVTSKLVVGRRMTGTRHRWNARRISRAQLRASWKSCSVIRGRSRNTIWDTRFFVPEGDLS